MKHCPKCSAPLHKEWKVCGMCKHKRDDKTLGYTLNMTTTMSEEEILNAAWDIHNKNIEDAKIKAAVQDLQEVECAVSEKEVKVQLLSQQLVDANEELEKYRVAKFNFASHRDIKIFRSELKIKTIIC